MGRAYLLELSLLLEEGLEHLVAAVVLVLVLLLLLALVVLELLDLVVVVVVVAARLAHLRDRLAEAEEFRLLTAELLHPFLLRLRLVLVVLVLVLLLLRALVVVVAVGAVHLRHRRLHLLELRALRHQPLQQVVVRAAVGDGRRRRRRRRRRARRAQEVLGAGLELLELGDRLAHPLQLLLLHHQHADDPLLVHLVGRLREGRRRGVRAAGGEGGGGGGGQVGTASGRGRGWGRAHRRRRRLLLRLLLGGRLLLLEALDLREQVLLRLRELGETGLSCVHRLRNSARATRLRGQGVRDAGVVGGGPQAAAWARCLQSLARGYEGSRTRPAM